MLLALGWRRFFIQSFVKKDCKTIDKLEQEKSIQEHEWISHHGFSSQLGTN